MKKRTVCLFLVLAFVITMIPSLALAAGSTSSASRSEVTQNVEGLEVNKEITTDSNGNFNGLKLESYATGTIGTKTQIAPTDYVLVVDQSGSMTKKDMAQTYTKSDTTKWYCPQEEDATLNTYYREVDEDGNEHFYKVYRKRGYLFQYRPQDTVYVGDCVSNLGWFQRETVQNLGAASEYYYNPSLDTSGSRVGSADDNHMYPINISSQGGFLEYWIRFRYTDISGTSRVLTYPDKPYYQNPTGGYFGPGDRYWGISYRVANWTAKLFSGNDSEKYTYASIGPANTGMYVRQVLFSRHVGYNQLAYKDDNGEEHILMDMTYCDADGNPVGGKCDNETGIPAGNHTSTTTAYWEGTLWTADESGKITRLQALKNALNSFVDTVSSQTNSDGTTPNHRVAIVGFADADSSNTELLTGTDHTSGIRYSSITPTNYKNAMLDVSDSNQLTRLRSAINEVDANGGTEGEYGLYMAKNVLDARETTQYTNLDENPVERPKKIIYFTDGTPGNYDEDNQYVYGNKVIDAAKNIKTSTTLNTSTSKTEIYTIGVFGEADTNPLVYRKYRLTNSAYNADHTGELYTFEPDYVKDVTESTLFRDYHQLMYRIWKRDTKGFGNKATDTIADYMETISSHYPNATRFVDPEWAKEDSADYGNRIGDYTAMVSASRGNRDTSKRYYMLATNNTQLEEAFNSVAEESAQEAITPVTLDGDSELRDVINTEYVDLPVGGLSGHVAAYTVKCTGKDENGNFTFDENNPTQTFDASQISINGNKIVVNGFDYSAKPNIVGVNKNTGVASGYKLVVLISGLSEKDVPRMEDEPTNLSGSGIYKDHNTSDDDATAEFESPVLPRNGFKVIVKDEKGDQIGDPQLIKADGTFDITSLIPQHKDSNNKVVYEKLYGGIFQDEDLTTVAALKENETGKSFTPTKGETYYLKEVDPSYLAIKTIYTTYGSELKGRYDVALIDNAKYSYVGFDYGEDKYAQSSDYYDEIDVITYKHGSKVDNIVGVSRVFGSGATGKMAVNTENTKDFAGDVHPYWITLDGVKVTGPVIRTMIADGQTEAERTDTEDLAFIKCTPVDIALTNGLDAKGIFVADPDAEGEVAPSESYARILGYTLSLKGNIAMNFYTELSDDVANDPNAYMQFSLPGGNHTAEKVKVSEARIGEVDGKQCYIFPAGIAAKDMTGDIKGQFVQPGGIQSEEKTTSVQWYCEKIIANKDGKYSEKSVELAKAIENYGGYAQLSFGYKTDDLANAGKDYPLPEIDLNSIADPVKNGTCTGAKYLGTTAMLTTTTGLRHYFKLDSDAANYSFMVNGEELEVGSDSKGAYVLIDDIWAKSLGDAIELTVTNKEDDTTFTLSYSVYNYVKQALKGKSTREETKDMVRALYGYGEAAKAYLATEN